MYNITEFISSPGLAAVVGGVFSNLASAANAILSSPSKIGTINFMIMHSICALCNLNANISTYQCMQHCVTAVFGFSFFSSVSTFSVDRALLLAHVWRIIFFM